MLVKIQSCNDKIRSVLTDYGACVSKVYERAVINKGYRWLHKLLFDSILDLYLAVHKNSAGIIRNNKTVFTVFFYGKSTGLLISVIVDKVVKPVDDSFLFDKKNDEKEHKPRKYAYGKDPALSESGMAEYNAYCHRGSRG